MSESGVLLAHSHGDVADGFPLVDPRGVWRILCTRRKTIETPHPAKASAEQSDAPTTNASGPETAVVSLSVMFAA